MYSPQFHLYAPILLQNIITKSTLLVDQANSLIGILNQSYLTFNGRYYTYTERLLMGFPLSLFMADGDSNLLQNILFWARYVDDILCIHTGTQRQLKCFLNLLNSINKIKFIKQDTYF